MNYKRILIISANPTSDIFNNGKTISAFFDKYPKEKMAQLYFSTAYPDKSICSTYFKISDVDILNYRLKKSKTCGSKVKTVTGLPTQTQDDIKVRKVKKGDFTRLLREFLWNNDWKTEQLIEWLDDFKPEVIFFLAGDGVFSYKICKYIVERYHAKLAMYITDDYILPRTSFSLWGMIRRKTIRKYMEAAVSCSSALFTISEPMRVCYKTIFGKDSFVVANMHVPTQHMQDNRIKNDDVIITYAGGLHYNRHETILSLVRTIRKMNETVVGNKKIVLYIYSGTELKKSIMDELLQDDCCVWGGLLDSKQLENQLNSSDYLLHVESFKKENICDTKLSLSTKIPEYMSYNKPIIAVGPAEVASIMYLQGCSCCITELSEMEDKLRKVVYDEEQGKVLANLAYSKYLENHDKGKIQPKIINILNNI